MFDILAVIVGQSCCICCPECALLGRYQIPPTIAVQAASIFSAVNQQKWLGYLDRLGQRQSQVLCPVLITSTYSQMLRSHITFHTVNVCARVCLCTYVCVLICVGGAKKGSQTPQSSEACSENGSRELAHIQRSPCRAS